MYVWVTSHAYIADTNVRVCEACHTQIRTCICKSHVTYIYSRYKCVDHVTYICASHIPIHMCIAVCCSVLQSVAVYICASHVTHMRYVHTNLCVTCMNLCVTCMNLCVTYMNRCVTCMNLCVTYMNLCVTYTRIFVRTYSICVKWPTYMLVCRSANVSRDAAHSFNRSFSTKEIYN